jgi:hypothetical protein
LGNPEGQKTFIENVKPITVRKIIYDKGVAIVYNPSSGKRKDIRPYIEKRLNEANIKMKFFETERRMHAFEIV